MLRAQASSAQEPQRRSEIRCGWWWCQENADWNVGRLLDAVDDMGELDRGRSRCMESA